MIPKTCHLILEFLARCSEFVARTRCLLTGILPVERCCSYDSCRGQLLGHCLCSSVDEIMRLIEDDDIAIGKDRMGVDDFDC